MVISFDAILQAVRQYAEATGRAPIDVVSDLFEATAPQEMHDDVAELENVLDISFDKPLN